MSSLTVPLEQHITAADRERGLALINRCMCRFVDGIHAADLATVQHESERLEGLQSSPVVKSMRLIVDQELASRAAD
jgi:hypothetical protein